MTKNPKSGELPAPIDELNADTRELIIDHYLARRHLLARIADLVDADIDVDDDQAIFTHPQTVQLLLALTDVDDDPGVLERSLSKPDVLQRLDDHLDLGLTADAYEVPKPDLVTLYVYLATGDHPRGGRAADLPAADNGLPAGGD